MSINKIIIKNAIIITSLIGGFFFLSKMVGLAENPYLRFLNLVFVLFGIYLSIKENIFKNKEAQYIVNLGVGVKTAVLAVFLSVIGFLIYTKFIAPNFISVMDDSFLIGGDSSLAEIVFTLLLEGMATSFIGSFIIMQFYKNHNKKEI